MFATRFIQLAAVLSVSLPLTEAVRLCLVKKTLDISNTTVECLESIQFEYQGETYHFPEELQPLSKHPLIAEQPKVINLLKSMRQSNQLRYLRIILPDELREFYLEVTENFITGAELLEKGPYTAGTSEDSKEGQIQNGTCVFKDIGCTFKGTPRALDYHLASASMSHLLLMSALVSKQQTEISKQQTEISNQTARYLILQAEIERQKTEISGQRADILKQREDILSSLRNESGSVFWKISNYSSQLRAAKSQKDHRILSDIFSTSTNGYKLRVSLNLNGYGAGEGSHLSIYLNLLPGDHDSFLEWPFTLPYSFTLIDQAENSNEARHITHKVTPDPTIVSFQRPPKGTTPSGYGTHKFVSHETLKTRDYVKDDTILIKIQVYSS